MIPNNNNNNNGDKPKGKFINKEVLQYSAAAVFLVLIFVLIAYLTFVPTPEENKGVILILIGVLTGSAGNAIPVLFGESKESKVTALEERIEKMEKTNDLLKVRNEVLKAEYDRIIELLVQRHVIDYTKGSTSSTSSKI